MPKIEHCKEQEEKYHKGDAIKFTFLGKDHLAFICRTGPYTYMLIHSEDMDRWTDRYVESQEDFITETQVKYLIHGSNVGLVLWARSEDVRITKEC